MEPSRIELHYTVRFFDPIRKKWTNSNYKMSAETAAKHYAHTEWQLIEHTKVERRICGDPFRDSAAKFQGPER